MKKRTTKTTKKPSIEREAEALATIVTVLRPLPAERRLAILNAAESFYCFRG